MENTTAGYKCPICDNKSDNLSQLTAHLYKTHADFSRLKCLACHIVFKKTNQLKYHMIRHRRKSMNSRPHIFNTETSLITRVKRTSLDGEEHLIASK